jgi:formylglycine-generating enzyme required for sulfatase activity
MALLNGDTLSVQSYYILDHEVTNLEYAEFLLELTNEKIKDESRVREENWKTEFKNPLTAYSEHYFSHPAYAGFPVVNITYEGATHYCEWLERKINSALEGKYKVQVRLPYHVELIRAAVGENLASPYSWKGNYLRNSEGQFLCNFVRLPQERLTTDSTGAFIIKPSQNANPKEVKYDDVLAPSKSYYPSEFGVYNLNGNAAEMTNERNKAIGGSWRSFGYDVRIQSVKKYEESSCSVGFRPVFTVVNLGQ